MSMRISSFLVAVLALGACSQSAAVATAEGDEQIACAVGGSPKFDGVCGVERTQQDGTLYLTVRHPDGGFRRFEVLKDGHGLAAADGAEVASTKLAANMLEVSIGPDQYRFPVTARGDAAKP
jgi:hypothetical protein